MKKKVIKPKSDNTENNSRINQVMVDLGQYLAKRRGWRDENQSQAGKAIGATATTISRIERGENVKLSLWFAYLEHLDVLDRVLKQFNPEDYGYESKNYYPGRKT